MNRPYIALPIAIAIAIAVAGCGGGSGTSAPVPEVSLSLSTDKAAVNAEVTLSWSSSHANSCDAHESWSGRVPTSGSTVISATEGGRHEYMLTCTGDGGTVSRSVTLAVPLAVHPTSYRNAKGIALSSPSLPAPQVIGLPGATFFHAGFAYADFFQEGSYGAVVQMPRIVDPGYGTGTPEMPADIFFLRRDEAGSWIDATAELLSDRTGCITPRKALVADFNADGRPDVFFACHGYDGAPGPGKPLLAENQVLLISAPGGGYRNLRLPIVAYGHGGSAADLNGDGLPDIVLTNTVRQGNGPYDNASASTDGSPFVLINRNDGVFDIDMSRLPAGLARKAVYNFELIDVTGDGRVDLLVGATAPGATPEPAFEYPNSLFPNDGTGRFSESTMTVLPNAPAPSGFMYAIALDFAYVDGRLYMAQVDAGYSSQLVRRIDLADLGATTVYQNSEPLSDGLLGSLAYTFDWLHPVAGGLFIGQMANCPSSPGPASICSVSFSR